VVKALLDKGIETAVADNLSSGCLENIAEFTGKKGFIEFFKGSINEEETLDKIFKIKFDTIFHLAASINVQKSIEDPKNTFDEDVVGTMRLLERVRPLRPKFIFISTCMVYSRAQDKPICENHPTLPCSPYAGAKLAAEKMALSYYYAYNLPVVILRPFNTYGPYQNAAGEGGVIATFLGNIKKGIPLYIYGDGTQTRDFLYVEDCAHFIYLSSIREKAVGEIINAGSGRDISISGLAGKINSSCKIEYLPHHHPRAEIKKMVCDSAKAGRILGWEAAATLEEGLKKTKDWIFS
jgi:nucleoside-diphosphate-sugar epimerase